MKKIVSGALFLLVIVTCKKNDAATVPAPTPVNPAITQFRILDSSQMVTDLQALSSDAFKGRKAGTPEIVLSHQLIQSRLRQAGTDSFAINLSQDFILNSIQRKNIMGLVRGSTYPDKYIVVSAHYDHLGTSGTAIYHGADDNASGVACVLAMAKYFKQHQPAYSIIFALWDAEEAGLKGSAYFVNNLPAGLTLAKLKFNLNMDMIARSDNNSLWASGLSHFPQYSYLVDSVRNRTSIQLMSGYDRPTDPQDWTYQSDHGSFYTKNIAYLYLGVEDHADYHQPSDTFDKINLNRYVENANIAAQMILLLDRKLQ